MSNPLNAVGVIVETTGQGDIIAGSVISSAYFTPTESGAVDGKTYCWKLTEGNDVEFFFASWTAGTSTVNRSSGVTVQSKIGGTAGTNKIDLAGNARLYVVESSEAMRQLKNQRTVTGTSDTLDDLDGNGVVTYDSASSVAVSLAQAGTAGFLRDWFAFVRNINSGAVTITPTTSTINGASTLVLQNGDSAMIWSDGTNYQAVVWQAGAVRYDRAQTITAAQQVQARANIGVSIDGYLYGLTTSNNATDATNDIDIAAGAAADSTAASIMRLASGLTKRLDAGWAPGTGQGMRNSAVSIADGTYHLYLVSKPNGVDADIYAHTSATVATVLTALQAESGGSAYTLARRIATIRRASSTIVPYVQRGDVFTLVTPVQDVEAGTMGTSAVTRTLTSIPTGIVVLARVIVHAYNATSSALYTYHSALNTADLTPSDALTDTGVSAVDAGFSFYNSQEKYIETNTSAQIRTRFSISGATVRSKINTLGWTDYRGRFTP